MSMILIASLYSNFANAEMDGVGYLEGIGYWEQELQVAIQSVEATGLNFVSNGGGTHIFIKGMGLADNAPSNTVVLYSKDLNVSYVASPLTEEDAYNSHPMMGNIAYRLPALDVLIGAPMNFLD